MTNKINDIKLTKQIHQQEIIPLRAETLHRNMILNDLYEAYFTAGFTN